jgi:uncharacterized protein YndB with AHSA1/START domain
MAQESFQITTFLPADPLVVYEAWLDPDSHTAFTGHSTSIDPVIGGVFRAGDGFYEGQLLWLDPGRLIVKSWRTAEFPPDTRPSVVEIRLHPHEGGTRLELIHRDVPSSLRERYEEGWERFYFGPLAGWLQARRPMGVQHLEATAPTS